MTLPAPVLDDRRFQDLVDEAKRRVQQRCPEWTDHNVSDPGVTLIETFAFMVDQLLYRLNRVPDRLYVKLLDLIGVRLFPPTAAEADVTFWLSAPQEETVTIPAGTEVATERTEMSESLSFTVERPLTIPSCELRGVAVQDSRDETIEDRTGALKSGAPCRCFGDPPVAGDAFLVALSSPAPSVSVLLRIECRIEGVGVDPLRPPLVWEAWTERGWRQCRVERDETGGLNRPGYVIVDVPRGHASTSFCGISGGWLRCRVVPPAIGQPAYQQSPRVLEIVAGTIGGTASAVNAELVDREVVGVSDGTPGQRFPLRHAPVVASGRHVLEVSMPLGWEEWSQVPTFASSGPNDKHFELDEALGEVVLGPAVRTVDGALVHYGAVPPPGATLRIQSYRAGGGSAGNVAAGAISVLKGAIPFVTGVENRTPATGGVDAEDVESAKARGPLVLRTRNRAVTASDYEALARESAPEVARVKCVDVADGDVPGMVRVLVVPHVRESTQLDAIDLLPSEETLTRIARYLDERRTVGTRVHVQPPRYQAITIVARLRARSGQSLERIQSESLARLNRYFHPTTGGPDGTGWPFGRSVHLGEVHGVLQRIPGIDLVEAVRLYPADPVTKQRGDAVHRVDLDPSTLVYSYNHDVLVEES